jgi:hypothetical protein
MKVSEIKKVETNLYHVSCAARTLFCSTRDGEVEIEEPLAVSSPFGVTVNAVTLEGSGATPDYIVTKAYVILPCG